MSENSRAELYQQVILEHNHKPKNFGELADATHDAEGYNPLCGDHLHIYLHINHQDIIDNISFKGDGCAISRASASMMTVALKGKPIAVAKSLFEEFHQLILGHLKPESDANHLGKLAIFSGIWQYPSRVKCASLCWHTMKGALEKTKTITTE
ncbi:MAG: SUF system NifU family Fe-S cluster assembly protein [Candidatus Omnitrophica bacterium]|nr:SUF system NifU family Fe-S cluster assembly protein [Candidatus Omnitrophota bacterium]